MNAKHDNLNIVLVDKRDYLDLNFVSPRLLVQPEDASKIVKPLNSLPWMKGCTFVQDVVTSIGKSSVTFQGRDALEFDICVICTGAKHLHVWTHFLCRHRTTVLPLHDDPFRVIT